MKRCKHAHVESGFSTSINKEKNKYEDYDLDKEGIAHSHKGIWFKSSLGPICSFLYNGDVEKQFKERRGFFYCDEKRCYECEFYEPEEKGKDIKIRKRNPLDSKLRHEVFKRDGYKFRI